MPSRPGAGVEQDTDDRQVEGRPTARRGVRPIGFVIDRSPTVLAVLDKVAPARMERDVERGIILPRALDYEIDRCRQARQIDAEMRKLVVKPDREHPLRALANGPRA